MHRVCVNRPHCTSQAHHAGCIHSAYLMVGGFAQYPSTRKALTNALHVSDSVPQQALWQTLPVDKIKSEKKRHLKPVLLWTPRGFQLQNPLAVSARIGCFKKNLFQYKMKIQWNLHGLTNKLVAYTRWAHLHTAEKETNEWRTDYVFDPFPISLNL